MSEVENLRIAHNKLLLERDKLQQRCDNLTLEVERQKMIIEKCHQRVDSLLDQLRANENESGDE